MPKILIDLTLCFAKGETQVHGGGEYGKAAARFLANRDHGFEVVALVAAGDREVAGRELGGEVPVQEVGEGPLEELPAHLNQTGNILFLPFKGEGLTGQGQPVHPRLVVVEHGQRYREKASSISDHLCHPLMRRGVWKWAVCAYAAYLRKKRLDHAEAKLNRRFQTLREQDRVVAPSRHSQYALYLALNRIPFQEGSRDEWRIGRLPPLAPFLSDEGPESELDRQGILLLSVHREVKNAERFLEGVARHYPCREVANREGFDLVGAEGACRRRLEKRFGGILNLRFHPYVPADRLETMMRRARVLAYPSLSEGYGIPPVEAFKWGTPVITSGVTALPEVVGGAAVLADPMQRTEMANRVLQLLADDHFWQTKAVEGRKRFEHLRDQTHACWDQFVRSLQ